MEFTGRKMTFLNCELRHEQIVCESLTNDTLCFPIECPPLIVLIKLMNVYLAISQRQSSDQVCQSVLFQVSSESGNPETRFNLSCIIPHLANHDSLFSVS